MKFISEIPFLIKSLNTMKERKKHFHKQLMITASKAIAAF